MLMFQSASLCLLTYLDREAYLIAEKFMLLCLVISKIVCFCGFD